MRNKNLFLFAAFGFLILTSFPGIIFGQSGRQQKAPEPVPTPLAGKSQSPNQSKTRPGIVYDDNQKSRYKFIVAQNLRSFHEQLNEAGAQGYKFVDVVKVDGSQLADFSQTKLFAIMKFDGEVPYEYSWFESFNTFYFHSDNLSENQNKAALQRFYFVQRIPLVEWGCETADLAPADDKRKNWTPYRKGSIYLFERPLGLNKTRKYQLASSADVWGAQPSKEMTEQVNGWLREGYLPVTIGSSYEIVLEKSGSEKELLAANPGLRVIRSEFGLKKEINKAAAEGYRIALFSDWATVMYRDDERSAPVAYYWLQPKKKDFRQSLSALLNQGAVYRMTAPANEGCDDSFDGNLIFERKISPTEEKRDYQLLKLIDLPKFFSTPAKAAQTIISPPSEKTMADFEKLLDEGYQFRDLFNADGVYALFQK